MTGPFLPSPWDKGRGEHWRLQGDHALSGAGTITLKTDGLLEKHSPECRQRFVPGKSKGAEAKGPPSIRRESYSPNGLGL